MTENSSKIAGKPATTTPDLLTGADRSSREGTPLFVWLIAAAVILAVALGLVFASRHTVSPASNLPLPIAARSSSIALTQLQMSESTSLSGGKSTFLDGVIANTGPDTITGITVQVLFRNAEELPPRLVTLPLTLIRTREPYIDTELISAAPLIPGAQNEFRLIFEAVPSNWNQQMPEIHITQVFTR